MRVHRRPGLAYPQVHGQRHAVHQHKCIVESYSEDLRQGRDWKACSPCHENRLLRLSSEVRLGVDNHMGSRACFNMGASIISLPPLSPQMSRPIAPLFAA